MDFKVKRLYLSINIAVSYVIILGIIYTFLNGQKIAWLFFFPAILYPMSYPYGFLKEDYTVYKRWIYGFFIFFGYYAIILTIFFIANVFY